MLQAGMLLVACLLHLQHLIKGGKAEAFSPAKLQHACVQHLLQASLHQFRERIRI